MPAEPGANGNSGGLRDGVPTVLVVGAGFAGAVYARTLAENGLRVHVIDQRPHVGGNAYDETAPTGVRVHRYGPHLLHTNLQHVMDWLRRFAAFVPYQHRVEADLPGGRCAPLPINRSTINMVFDVVLETEDEVRDFLAAQAMPVPTPRNAAEHLHGRIGKRLTDLFFRPYTKKMWDLDLEELDAAVIKRIPLRFDDDDRYFPDDAFQFLPERGYAAVFENILDHDRIGVSLSTRFDPAMLRGYDHCFNSMPIDAYFDEALGPLPYRSIRFLHREEPAAYARGTAAVVNFTDARPYTRETDWSRLPGHAGGTARKTVTLEQPCDYRDNHLERYYPIKTSDGRNDALYRAYCELAAREDRMTFIGRCGTYQYLDMHQVINQSLLGAQKWLASRHRA